MQGSPSVLPTLYVCACVCACMRACVCARARACVRVWQEALWYSVLLNETMLGTPSEEQRQSLRQPMSRWLPPRLRRPTSTSAGDTYRRTTHVAADIAAAVAKAAATVKVAAGQLPAVLRDGRAWAYGSRKPTRAPPGGTAADGSRLMASLAPKFYLPEENWPSEGPCLLCFSLTHITKTHGRATSDPSPGTAGQGAVLAGDVQDETEESDSEEGQAVARSVDAACQDASIASRARKGAGAVAGDGDEGEADAQDETDEGEEESDEVARCAMLSAYRRRQGPELLRLHTFRPLLALAMMSCVPVCLSMLVVGVGGAGAVGGVCM